MPEPVLQREVELPKSHASGAAVVMVAAMAMFTAVGASAFVVRVRMQAAARAEAAWRTAPARAVPVALVASQPTAADLEQLNALDETDQARVAAYRTAVSEGHLARALSIHNGMPREGAAAVALVANRDEVASEFLARELEGLSDDLDNRDCEAVNARLLRLARLLPEKNLPRTMEGCVSP